MSAIQQVLLAYGPAGGGGPSVTWDPLQKGPGVTLSGGDLVATTAFADSVLATVAKTAGKWYWEVLVGAQNTVYGQVGATFVGAALGSPISSSGGGALRGDDGFVAGNVVGIAMDLDASPSTLTCYVNNVFNKTISFTKTTHTLPAVGDNYGDASSHTFTARFNSASQTYSPPSGYTPYG